MTKCSNMVGVNNKTYPTCTVSAHNLDSVGFILRTPAVLKLDFNKSSFAGSSFVTTINGSVLPPVKTSEVQEGGTMAKIVWGENYETSYTDT